MHKDETEALKDFFRYNSYVRKKYLDAIGNLPKEEITRDRGASFPSVLDIYAHVIDAIISWFAEYGLPMDHPEIRRRGTIHSIEDLKEEERKMDAAVMKFVEGLTPADLDNRFEDWDGQRKWNLTLREMLWHLVEEELQHRGEINALLWQIDIDPPVTDWLDWKAQIGELKSLP